MFDINKIINNIERWQALRGENRRTPYEIHSNLLPVIEAGSEAIPFLINHIKNQSINKDLLIRELLLILLGHIRDPQVDELLIQLLDDAVLRPKSIYLLGCINSKGWPYRERSVIRLLTHIYPFCHDDSTYLDPWYETTFWVCDFALGAFVRIAGKENFPLIKKWEHQGNWGAAEFIGLTLPDFQENTRFRLQREVQNFWEEKKEVNHESV